MYSQLIPRVQVVRKGSQSDPPPSISPEESLPEAPPTQIQEEERLHPKRARQWAQYRLLVNAHRSKRTGELRTEKREKTLAEIRAQADCLARALEIPFKEHVSNFA